MSTNKNTSTTSQSEKNNKPPQGQQQADKKLTAKSPPISKASTTPNINARKTASKSSPPLPTSTSTQTSGQQQQKPPNNGTTTTRGLDERSIQTIRARSNQQLSHKIVGPVSPTNSDIRDYQQALATRNSPVGGGSSRIGKTLMSPSTDPATQLRSTLALGQLITAKTPTAGSRMIASELRQLNSTLKMEGALLRKEIASLPSSLTESLKVVLEEDREQRNNAGLLARRPIQFGQFPYRRLPIFRRPRRVSLQGIARKSTADLGHQSVATSTSPPASSTVSKGLTNPTSASSSAAASRSPTNNQQAAAVDLSARPRTTTASKSTSPTGQTAEDRERSAKSPATQAAKLVLWALKTARSRDQSSSSYDGEADTDSDSSPASTP